MCLKWKWGEKASIVIEKGLICFLIFIDILEIEERDLYGKARKNSQHAKTTALV